MLRARVAVGVVVAVLALGAVVMLDEGDAPGAPPDDSCASGESTYTTDSLHDLRSFSDAMAIVRGVKESVPPPPEGPEGFAGLIGRHVTVRVEGILWRRPDAPEAPRRFRFNDLGWTGTLEDRRPMVVCGETRMKLGRRYLAPVVRHNGTWYPIFTARLRLDGDRVVGGVDGGEAENSHQALAGRSVRGAAQLVARTKPYRAVVVGPSGSPARRWQRVNRDRYRLWRERPGMPVVVMSGVTPKSRYQLYVRFPARGGMCVGLSARALWRGRSVPSGEGCGPRTTPARSVRPIVASTQRGLFAYGHTGRRVVTVRVRFAGEDETAIQPEIQTAPSPTRRAGGGNRFWVVPAEGNCPAVTVQGLDIDGAVLDEHRMDLPPEPPPGSPDPYAACRSG